MIIGGEYAVTDYGSYTIFEERCQEIVDCFYTSQGHSVDRRPANRAYDLLILLQGKRADKVEEKFRMGIYHDLLIELIQHVKSGNRGWYYETGCEHLHYIMCKGTLEEPIPTTLYRVKWPAFKLWFADTFLSLKPRPNCIISTEGWGITLNITVPIVVIPKKLITTYLLTDRSIR